MADFQQFYGLELPLHSDPPDIERFAVLWGQLPATSRCARAEDPDRGWTEGEHMLRSIEYSLRVLVWSKTKYAQDGTNEPRPLPSPGEALRRHKAAERSRERAASVAAQLGLPPDILG